MELYNTAIYCRLSQDNKMEGDSSSMVDLKFMEKNYMVDNKIIQIIYSNLNKHVKFDDIKYYSNNELLKYVINFQEYYFEILYYYVDNFYRIRIENNHNNQLQSVVFLTKSKKFQKDIKKILKDFKLSKKLFENHMTCFSIFLNKLLDNEGELNSLSKTYISDLNFDGIFI